MLHAERGEPCALGDSAACAARIIVVFYDSGGSNGGFHARTLPPCFGYSHLARLSRYAHAAWTPWDRAPSFDSRKNAHMRCRQIRSNQSKSSLVSAHLLFWSGASTKKSTHIPTTLRRNSWKVNAEYRITTSDLVGAAGRRASARANAALSGGLRGFL